MHCLTVAPSLSSATLLSILECYAVYSVLDYIYCKRSTWRNKCKCVLITPVKTCNANCGQMVVCTDSLWEHTITLPNSSIIDPYGHPLPEGGSPKIKSKLF